MRSVNVAVLSAANTASRNGSCIDSSQLFSATFHVLVGDSTAVAVVKIQGSNDPISLSTSSVDSTGKFVPTNWQDIPGANLIVSNGVGGIIPLPQLSYRWMRAIYTSVTAGNTTIVVNIDASGF